MKKTDFFANFKNLLPGTGRSQKILVKNAYKADAAKVSYENMIGVTV